MPVALDIPPRPGEIVRVRSRRYLVEGVELASRPEDQTLVRLSCLEHDAEGEELEILWEKEVDAHRISAADWTKLAKGQFDDPRQFGALAPRFEHRLFLSATPHNGHSNSVLALPIDGLPEEAPELRLPKLLDDYRLAREERLRNAPRSVQNASALVLCSLQKRLLAGRRTDSFMVPRAMDVCSRAVIEVPGFRL